MAVILTFRRFGFKIAAEIKIRKHNASYFADELHRLCMVKGMFFSCHEMGLHYFLLSIAFTSVCRWKFHEKGIKLKTFCQLYVIIFSDVVVR